VGNIRQLLNSIDVIFFYGRTDTTTDDLLIVLL